MADLTKDVREMRREGRGRLFIFLVVQGQSIMTIGAIGGDGVRRIVRALFFIEALRRLFRG